MGLGDISNSIRGVVPNLRDNIDGMESNFKITEYLDEVENNEYLSKLPGIKDIIKAIRDAYAFIKDIIDKILNALEALLNWLADMFDKLLEMIKEFLNFLLGILKGLFGGKLPLWLVNLLQGTFLSGCVGIDTNEDMGNHMAGFVFSSIILTLFCASEGAGAKTIYDGIATSDDNRDKEDIIKDTNTNLIDLTTEDLEYTIRGINETKSIYDDLLTDDVISIDTYNWLISILDGILDDINEKSDVIDVINPTDATIDGLINIIDLGELNVTMVITGKDKDALNGDNTRTYGDAVIEAGDDGIVFLNDNISGEYDDIQREDIQYTITTLTSLIIGYLKLIQYSRLTRYGFEKDIITEYTVKYNIGKDKINEAFAVTDDALSDFLIYTMKVTSGALTNDAISLYKEKYSKAMLVVEEAINLYERPLEMLLNDDNIIKEKLNVINERLKAKLNDIKDRSPEAYAELKKMVINPDLSNLNISSKEYKLTKKKFIKYIMDKIKSDREIDSLFYKGISMGLNNIGHVKTDLDGLTIFLKDIADIPVTPAVVMNNPTIVDNMMKGMDTKVVVDKPVPPRVKYDISPEASDIYTVENVDVKPSSSGKAFDRFASSMAKLQPFYLMYAPYVYGQSAALKSMALGKLLTMDADNKGGLKYIL